MANYSLAGESISVGYFRRYLSSVGARGRGRTRSGMSTMRACVCVCVCGFDESTICIVVYTRRADRCH